MNSKSYSFIVFTAMFMMICSGCSMFPKMEKSSAVLDEMSKTESVAEYFVEMHPNLGKPKLYRGKISEPTTVQQALEASGAIDEFKRISVDVYRQLPDGRPLKLPVELKKGKQVRYEQDYSLHPNDRIVVRPKSSSPIDKLVDQVFGEL
ncbi:MAG: hypothetical protein AAGA30_14250 [Planctomycetota bacterium]